MTVILTDRKNPTESPESSITLPDSYSLSDVLAFVRQFHPDKQFVESFEYPSYHHVVDPVTGEETPF